jgi:hypothetical protein
MNPALMSADGLPFPKTRANMSTPESKPLRTSALSPLQVSAMRYARTFQRKRQLIKRQATDERRTQQQADLYPLPCMRSSRSITTPTILFAAVSAFAEL